MDKPRFIVREMCTQKNQGCVKKEKKGEWETPHFGLEVLLSSRASVQHAQDHGFNS